MTGPYTHKGLHNPPTYEVVIKVVLPYQQTDPADWCFEALLEYIAVNLPHECEVQSFELVRALTREPGGAK